MLFLCSTVSAAPPGPATPPRTGVVFATEADGTYHGADDNDVFGARVTVSGDGDGDGRPDLAVAAAHADPYGVHQAGVVYVFYGPQPGEFAAADAGVAFVGERDDWAGFGLAWVGDLDGDGDDDLAIGAKNDQDGAGALYLVPMPLYSDALVPLAKFTQIFGEEASQFGTDVTSAADHDRDGVPDLWIAAPRGAEATGAVHLLPGATSGQGLRVEDVALGSLLGSLPGDEAGGAVNDLGDVDGDGLHDLGTGAIGDDANGVDAGAVYLVFTPPTGAVPLTAADVVLWGDLAGDNAGARVFGVGDLDGDGRAEVAASVRSDSTAGPSKGAFHVLDDDAWPAQATLGSVTSVKLLGEESNSDAGALATACELNGDAHVDLIVTAKEAGQPGPQTGKTYVFYGPIADGTYSMGTAPFILHGTQAKSNFGQDVSCADLDLDGVDDLVVGAEGQDSTTGAVFLYFGIDLTPDSTGTDTGTGIGTAPVTDGAPDTGAAGPPADPGCGCATGSPATSLLLALVLATYGAPSLRFDRSRSGKSWYQYANERT